MSNDQTRALVEDVMVAHHLDPEVHKDREKLADALGGLSERTVRRWLAGETRPYRRMILRLQRALEKARKARLPGG